MSKQFHISDVLSITTDRLVSPRHMEGIYDLLNYMANDNLFTHQLSRVSEECKVWLFRQHPWLKDIDAPPVGALATTPEDAGLEQAERRVNELRQEGWCNPQGTFQPSEEWPLALRILNEARESRNAAAMRQINKWMQPIIAEHGEWLSIEPIPADDHARRDAVAELESMMPSEQIIVI